MKRMAVLTSGGDAPGMNAAIRAVVRVAISRGVEVCGVQRGYIGLMQGDVIPMGSNSVGGIIEEGGTVLHTARCSAFRMEAGQAEAAAALQRAGVDGLVVIGGNGSQTGTLALHGRGVHAVGVASTIDNDFAAFDITIGADTALNTIVEAIDRIRDTASSHERTFIVETMGRGCGWLALHAALATGADIVLVPEAPWELAAVAARIEARQRAQKTHTIIVIAEGAGSGTLLARQLTELMGAETRATVLGHVQRGGAPTAFDRILASRSAAAATQALLDGRSGVVAGLQNGRVTLMAIEEALAGTRALDAALFELEGTFGV